MLQEIIKSIILAYSSESEWKESLLHEAEKEKDGKFAIVYGQPYVEMRVKGDKYDVTDMDITLMTNLLISKSFVFGVDLSKAKSFVNYIIAIKDDRCFASHLGENESFFDLYQKCLVTTGNLNRFLNLFCKEFKLDKIPNRYDICIDYTNQINEINAKMNMKCESYFHDNFKQMSFMHDIEILKKSVDKKREHIWITLLEKHMSIAKIDHDFTDYNMFMITAAQNGVEEAYSNAAELFYEDEKYDEAERYYAQVEERLTPHELIHLANIYLNGWSEDDKEEEGKAILKRVEERYNIDSIVNEKQETIWQIVNRKPR